MPYIIPGVYLHSSSDLPYEAEECYFLDYQITCALAAIDYLFRVYVEAGTPFGSKYTYYHFYTDHLLFSWGQIASRFVITGHEKGEELERKQSCIHNFSFGDKEYPVLSDKSARNTIEHLDEYNHFIIQKYHGVGGFNLIDSSESQELIEYLRDNRQTHPYTLDLIKKQLYIQRKEDEKTVDLVALNQELVKLQRSVQKFKPYVIAKAKDPNWAV